jgi:hypothetical protein
MSAQGVVGSIIGSSTSNLTMYDSVFEANETGGGIIGSSSENTLGGVVYVGITSNLEVNNCTFQQISSVVSGGGLYINSSDFVDIQNSVFSHIIVRVSGGICYIY